MLSSAQYENVIMLAAGQGEGKQRQGPAGRDDGTEGALP